MRAAQSPMSDSKRALHDLHSAYAPCVLRTLRAQAVQRAKPNAYSSSGFATCAA